MDDLKPFSKLTLSKYFQHDVEKILMAYRLSGSIQSELKNIRASGDEVELSVKNFFKEKLFPKYHVCDGHIIDKTLKVSPQYDLIISENSKNPILFNLSDKSELIYFETVYCFAEIKKSFYKNDLISSFSKNIKRTKKELKRDLIDPKFIETANSGFYIEQNLTNLPCRNPLLSFMIFINSSQLDATKIGKFFNSKPNSELPNFIVLLDQGMILNVNKKEFEVGKLKINLYPEFETEENIWILININEEQNVLIYQYMMVLEHLNNSVLSTPNLREYTNNLFQFTLNNIYKL
ncbi:hypothetical protein L1S34_06805 [Flavobacterium sp. K77]|uniref:DUF6602 domain-containing protein n=1 Tax=Flavobacterium sp. K77 TaxID=2910676 RepID=UPI001F2BA22D|nr:DUF6602 domain-containing protein [Flavobacterium sp. K77]MCF6140989.1 hypothetical protein [Flavobacterium sp. K77]